MRTLGRITMPWAQVSYTQYKVIPLIQMAEVTGAYGISFLIVVFNGTIAEWSTDRRKPAAAKRIRFVACLVAAVCVLGALRTQISEGGVRLTVAAMQPNFHVNANLNQDQSLSVISALSELAANSRHSSKSGDVSLYVWPESASPTDAVHDYRTYNVLRGLSERYHAAVTTGSRVDDAKTREEFNSSVLITDDGAAPQRYDKEQLVPFGEFIPFREMLPSVLDANFGFPPGDVTPGTNQKTLDFATRQGIRVALGPFICYESMYPPYARAMTRSGANLLITQSNDDWFQSESALTQHLSAVVMRAVENRRYVVRSTTTGITCIIDSFGRVVEQLPVNTPGSVVRGVRLISSKTIYNILGDWFVLVCGAYLASIVFRETGKIKGQRTAPPMENHP
jgi:apolipoprotein N-acyltransferase